MDMKKLIESLEECGMAPASAPAPTNPGSPVSMNVSLNASGMQNVEDLMDLIKNAGIAPKSTMAMPTAMPKDGHDDMAQLIAMADAYGEDPEEDMEEEWDNSPDEEYKDDDYMKNDLAGGINRRKKQYAKAQDGDNPMSVESISKDLMSEWKSIKENGSSR